jgi:hypothetical protein
MIKEIFRAAFLEREIEPSWAWADKHINFNRAANYDTPYKGRFDSGLMPFWKEPLEKARDQDTREIVVVKCSRAG